MTWIQPILTAEFVPGVVTVTVPFEGTLLLEVRPVNLLEVQLFGTLGAPLVRDSFQFGCPDTPAAPDCKPNLFHEVPRVSAQGGLALGVFFR